jgi:hypothetical protein
MCDLLGGGVVVSSTWLGMPHVPITPPLTGVTDCGLALSETFACVTLDSSGMCFGTTLTLPALHKLVGLLGCDSVP